MPRARKNFPVLFATPDSSNLQGKSQKSSSYREFEANKNDWTLYLNWPAKTSKDKEYTIALKYVLECSWLFFFTCHPLKT